MPSQNSLQKMKSLNFVNDKCIDKFIEYKNLLQKWSKVHNLTSTQSDFRIYENILDSIYPVGFLNLDNIKYIADIGSGAGFPAIGLSIILPKIEFLLIEPRNKRVSFLNTVRLNLELDNVKIVNKRVEDIFDYQADLIISRAVGNTELLMQISKNISKISTQYLLYKGEEVYQEISNLKNYDIIKFENRNYLYIKGDSD